MPEAGAPRSLNGLGRAGLWFASLLLAVAIFSVAFSLRVGGSDEFSFVFRITMIFALPVGVLYLPFAISSQAIKGSRFWVILAGGSLIGPLAIFAWCLVLQLGGGNAHQIWYGDPLIGVSAFTEMAFALMIGFTTTFVYLSALRLFRRGPRALAD